MLSPCSVSKDQDIRHRSRLNFFWSYIFRGSRGGWRGNYQNPNSYGQQRPDSASNDGRGSSYGGSRNWEVGIKIVGVIISFLGSLSLPILSRNILNNKALTSNVLF